jgi:hypothetical protein
MPRSDSAESTDAFCESGGLRREEHQKRALRRAKRQATQHEVGRPHLADQRMWRRLAFRAGKPHSRKNRPTLELSRAANGASG